MAPRALFAAAAVLLVALCAGAQGEGLPRPTPAGARGAASFRRPARRPCSSCSPCPPSHSAATKHLGALICPFGCELGCSACRPPSLPHPAGRALQEDPAGAPMMPPSIAPSPSVGPEMMSLP